MPLRIGAALSRTTDSRVAAIEAAQGAGAALRGEPADLAIVFACGAHLVAPETLLEGVHEALRPRALIGCGASGVLGGAEEVEDETAVVVWAANLGSGSAHTFQCTCERDGEIVELYGVPDLATAAGAVLLPDPATFATDALLAALRERAPAVPLLGGLASARTYDGSAALFLGETVLENGLVGVAFEGISLRARVSQGAAPLGPELTITRAEGHVVHELAGRPALEKLRSVVEELDERERGLIGGGVLLGIVIDSGKPEYEHGDFLVRGLTGADREGGAITLDERVRTGQVVRLHARDASGADRDLHDALHEETGSVPAAGALCFTCTGRGKGMFGIPNHDAAALAEVLGGQASAGFFAAGEIGPVAGTSFLHSFSATIGLFSA